MMDRIGFKRDIEHLIERQNQLDVSQIKPKQIITPDIIHNFWNTLYPNIELPCMIIAYGFEREDYFKYRTYIQGRDEMCGAVTRCEYGRDIDLRESSACNFYLPQIKKHFIIYRLDSRKTLSQQLIHELQHVYNFHVLKNPFLKVDD